MEGGVIVAEEEQYAIEMIGITKRFPGIVANDNVTLRLKKGEIHALLGENGAGKSTLMSVLFGLYQAEEGIIKKDGKEVHITDPNVANDLGIGMVHQHFKLVQCFTVLDNIILGVETTKHGFLQKEEARKKIEEAEEKYGLKVDLDAKVEDITVGMQQRTEILKMLYRQAEILIFDEPTAVLTPQEIDSLLTIIKNLRDGGKTIILITHKLEEIKKVADRCAILRRGKLIGVYDVATMDTKKMASLMVGHDISLSIDKAPAKFGKVILDVQDLHVENEDHFEVVGGVSFQIHAGEIFAIAGVSGNGQTEIADAVTGLLPAKSGKILLDGTDITDMDIRKRTRQGISYIPEDRQNVGLILDFALADDLALRNYYEEPFEQKQVLQKGTFNSFGDRLISKYDIRSANGNTTIVRSMSGGNQQKAIVGREIEQNAKLTIFVQPTRGLDIGAIDNIHRHILAERDRGKAVLLISLELDEVMQLADTIGVIYNGHIGKIAPAAEFTKEEVGEYMMGVRQ